ncbi:MAG TPA: glycosyltransferase, partial [Candidatus Sumerlaeota bacterium]|nr:glycosyltransferase [Candidatus Sumerlaeota bacterium]
LARSAPDWMIDLRFTHVDMDPAEAFGMVGVEQPPNLRVSTVFPRESSAHLTTDQISQVLNHMPGRNNERLFEEWKREWQGRIAGRRAVLYTRNPPFLRLFREMPLKNFPFFVEIHQLRYRAKVKASPDARPSEIKPLLRKARDTEFDLISLAEKAWFISGSMERIARRIRPNLNTGVLRSGYEPDRELARELTDPPDLSDEARDIDLLYSGQLYDWKGVHVAIQALRYCNPRIRLTIVGGNNAGDLSINQHIAEHLGVADRIDWLGHRPRGEVMRLQRRAKLSLVPLTRYFRISKWFTSPIKAFELMAAGTPMLVADLPTLRDLLEEDQTGAFARPNDPRDWARQIERVLADAPYRRRLAENGLRKIRDFTYDRRAATMRDEIQAWIDRQPDKEAVALCG